MKALLDLAMTASNISGVTMVVEIVVCTKAPVEEVPVISVPTVA